MGGPEGGIPLTSEHVIRSPQAGTVSLRYQGACTAEGELVKEGERFGDVSGHDLRWPVSGWLLEFVVRSGTVVEPGDPVARLWG